ncbi:MAG: gluconate 2-dehydrogenase subunit 3 family protein [Acidobacteriota bacterium]|nr:gluconate 2-dehydrogenase subunit 3 family protein [Acidobacteriota bacterium]
MQRRDFVKGLVAVPVAAQTALGQQSQSLTPTLPARESAVPNPRGMRAFQIPSIPSVVPDAVAEPNVRFFNEAQFAALERLSDLLMPPVEYYPGALQAEAPQFLDFLVSASFIDQQQLYKEGLDHLNAEARRLFGKQFAQLSSEQADKIVRPVLQPWISYHPPTEPFPRFIAIAHQDIRDATMNSELWSIAAISSGDRAPGVGRYWRPIDPDLKH